TTYASSSLTYHLPTSLLFLSLLLPSPPLSTLFPYTTLFRSLFWLWILATPGFRPRNKTSTDRSTLCARKVLPANTFLAQSVDLRSEEHTSELQSRFDLVCRLLLEKKKYQQT